MLGGAPIIGWMAIEQSKQLANQGRTTAAVIFPLIIAAMLFSGSCYVFWRDRHDIAHEIGEGIMHLRKWWRG
jgi:hypothetical protein